MLAAYIQHKLTVPGGAFMSDDKGGDADSEGEEAGGVVGVMFHFPI